MRLLVEVEPTRDTVKFKKLLEVVKRCKLVTGIEIPDAPLGRPKVLAIALARLAIETGVYAIPHVRLRDLNWNGFIQVVNAAYVLGVREVVLLRGDPPAHGPDIDVVTSEEAASYIKSDKRLRELRVGLYLSLRKSLDQVKARLDFPHADFFLVNWFRPKEHSLIVDYVHKRGKLIHVYLIVSTSPEELSSTLGGQPVYEVREVTKIIDMYEKEGVDAVVVSAPGSLSEVISVLCGHSS